MKRKANLPITTIVMIIVLLAFAGAFILWGYSAIKNAWDGTDKGTDISITNTNCALACSLPCSWGYTSDKAVNYLVCGAEDNVYIDGTCDTGTPNEDYIKCDCISCDVNKDSAEDPDPEDPEPEDPVECTEGEVCGDPDRGTITLPDFCCLPDKTCDTKVCPNNYTWTEAIYKTPTEGGHTYLGKYIGSAWDEASTEYRFPGSIEIKYISISLDTKKIPGDILSNGGYSVSADHIYYCVNTIDSTDTKFLFLSEISLMTDWATFFESTEIKGIVEPFAVFILDSGVEFTKTDIKGVSFKCNLVFNQDSINAIVGKESPINTKGGDIDITVG